MKKRILVIDDEKMVRTAIDVMLTSHNYDVVQCADGEEGLREARSLLPDLIVCDVTMPKMNGFDLIQELRKSNETSNIPFIFLTGQSLQSEMRKGMMLGADDYLTKPFVPDELIRVVELRLKKRDALEQQMQTKLDELRKSISLALPHEFRTPLTGILGFAEILKDSKSLSQEEAAYIGTHIHGSAKRLHRLLENMLLMAELNVDAADPSRIKSLRSSSCSIGNVITQRVEAHALEAGRNEDVQASISEARIKVLEAHFSRVIDELLSNALKFSNKGSKVEVKTSIEGGTAVISIEDRGKGMTQDQIQRLAAFVQFDRVRNEQQGSGLGLALVKKIAHLYGGSLSIESSKSVGTKVILKFPLAE